MLLASQSEAQRPREGPGQSSPAQWRKIRSAEKASAQREAVLHVLSFTQISSCYLQSEDSWVRQEHPAWASVLRPEELPHPEEC